VRVAARRDTVVEHIKDVALGMYDRDVAIRVHERVRDLSGFGDWSTDEVRAVAGKYAADVVVVERSKQLDLPVLKENARFRVYDLRR
jgi:hypothetical protein